LTQIAMELTAIFEDCTPEWVEVVYCDADVAKTQRFFSGEDLDLQLYGGGGTRFKPVFDYVDGLGEKIAALVYFTDLCGNVQELEEPGYPVLWGHTAKYKGATVPAFGEIVEVVC
jgi:predicted metal-dependent peptidase